MKAVIYARYSDDRQREASIDDQVRVCRQLADREGMTVAEVYADHAITGAVRARPRYQAMLDAGRKREFDILLLHDLSRLTRDDYELKGVLRRLSWDGIRIVTAADGYDSGRKGHKIHSGMKGLMNEMFLDDVRAWTHKGMTGKAVNGYNCGGRTYGYRNVPIEDPSGKKDHYGRPAVLAVRYEIDQEQAQTVRRIYDSYAAGWSYRSIADELNRDRVPSSRGSTWAESAIKVILDNEMYEGRLVWNRRAWARHPDTGKRTYRRRPAEEWVEVNNPDLRIVPAEVVEAVRTRQRGRSQEGAKPSGRKYLFSGLLACADCGASFIIVGGNQYGCSTYKSRGSSVCPNSTTVPRRIVESRLLGDLKSRLMGPRGLERFKKAATTLIEGQIAQSRSDGVEHELRGAKKTLDNILIAIKQGIVTPSTKQALLEAESRVSELEERVTQGREWSVSAILPRAVDRYQQAVDQLENRLTEHVEPARELIRSLLGGTIRVHRRGEYLEAEIPDGVSAILANSLNCRIDLAGCGGPQLGKSAFFVPLVEDNQPVTKRGRRRRVA